MKLHLQRNWVLLTPIALAYLLRGGKTGPTFLPVFFLAGVLFHLIAHRPQARLVPTSILWPFGLFLVWSLTALLSGPPVDIFLFYFSRAFLYNLVGVLIFQFADAA